MANKPRANRRSIKQTKCYALDEVQIAYVAEVAAKLGKSDSEAARHIFDEHRLFLSAQLSSTKDLQERNSTAEAA